MARTCLSRAFQFKLNAPDAKKVSVAGDFNSWNPSKLKARKDSKGNWTVKANLKAGRYEYKFYVDGNWLEDPNCSWRVTNPLGTQNCIIEVK